MCIKPVSLLCAFVCVCIKHYQLSKRCHLFLQILSLFQLFNYPQAYENCQDEDTSDCTYLILLLKNFLKTDKTEWCCSFFGAFQNLLLQLLVLLLWGFLYSTNFIYCQKKCAFLILAFEKGFKGLLCIWEELYWEVKVPIVAGSGFFSQYPVMVLACYIVEGRFSSLV